MNTLTKIVLLVILSSSSVVHATRWWERPSGKELKKIMGKEIFERFVIHAFSIVHARGSRSFCTRGYASNLEATVQPILDWYRKPGNKEKIYEFIFDTTDEKSWNLEDSASVLVEDFFSIFGGEQHMDFLVCTCAAIGANGRINSYFLKCPEYDSKVNVVYDSAPGHSLYDVLEMIEIEKMRTRDGKRSLKSLVSFAPGKQNSFPNDQRVPALLYNCLKAISPKVSANRQEEALIRAKLVVGTICDQSQRESCLNLLQQLEEFEAKNMMLQKARNIVLELEKHASTLRGPSGTMFSDGDAQRALDGLRKYRNKSLIETKK